MEQQATVITNTRLYQMIAQKHAMILEERTGMKFSSKRSICQVVRKQYGFKGNRAKLIQQMEELIRRTAASRGLDQ